MGLTGSAPDRAAKASPKEELPLTVDLEAGETGPAPEDGSGDPAGPRPDPPLVLVLLGRVGVGKSSTANTILGHALATPFAARRSAGAVTAECRTADGEWGGRRILVLDTPGLGDSTVPAEAIYAEICRGFSELVPEGAPCCLLLVHSLNSRVGEDDLAALTSIEENVFGPGMLAASVVVWTHLDLLDDGMTVQEYLSEGGERLHDILAKARGGSAALDNRKSGQASGRAQLQLEELLSLAASVALPQAVRPKERREFGRRSARRKRQMEAGVLRVHRRPVAGCVVA